MDNATKETIGDALKPLKELQTKLGGEKQPATDTTVHVVSDEPEHSHVWKRGILPGGKYIKTCTCGDIEYIPFEQWQVISDR